MLSELESFVENAIVTQRPVTESLFKEKTIINYPNKALRELMMNACMHRDYQANMPIRLYQFDDHVEIMNAGGLYGEARPENFPSVNDYRNPIIAEAMKEMKYVNMFNQGVKRVQDILHENGNKPAEFDVSKLTVFCVNVFSTESEAEGMHKQTQKNDTTNVPIKIPQLTDRQNKIYTTIKNVPINVPINVPYFASLFNVSEKTIKRDLYILRDKNLIKYVGSNKTGHWVAIDNQKSENDN